MLLSIHNVTKNFGGVMANRDISFDIAKGETVGLIGPNGSGKTTMMNLISGVFNADSGKIVFDGHDITRLPPEKICRLGIARTYQIPRPFPDLTALANVCVAVMCGKPRPHMSYSDAMLDAAHFLEFVGLFGKRNIIAHDMTLFELRSLELARALATTPKLILIDEVMAGLNPGEAKTAIELIERIIDEYHVTILWIEHVMKVIMEATDNVVVLQHGEKIVSGKPREVANNPKVVEAYLGEEYA